MCKCGWYLHLPRGKLDQSQHFRAKMGYIALGRARSWEGMWFHVLKLLHRVVWMDRGSIEGGLGMA